MGKARENHWRIPAHELREARKRDDVLRDVALALESDPGLATEARQTAGCNPYDNGRAANPRAAWNGREPL